MSFLPAACLLPRLKTLSRGRLLRLHWKLSHILFSLFSLFQNEDSWSQLFPEATANASVHCKKSITVGEPMFCSQDFFSFFFYCLCHTCAVLFRCVRIIPVWVLFTSTLLWTESLSSPVSWLSHFSIALCQCFTVHLGFRMIIGFYPESSGLKVQCVKFVKICW